VALELTDPQLFEQWERGRDFLGTPEAERIDQLFGDSAHFDFTPFFGGVDVAYIDGSHSYTYVKSDSENAFRMIGPEGTVLWDDYPHYPGGARLPERARAVAGTTAAAHRRHAPRRLQPAPAVREL